MNLQAASEVSVARPRWYVVQTQPHREMRAMSHLVAQGYRTFLPLHWKTTRHARQFRTAKAPFFPRYLFVELTVGRDRWRSINGTFGVAGLIMAGDYPKPVPVGVVEELLLHCGADGMFSPGSRIEADQPVRLTSGPFAGCVGRMTGMTSSGRVCVLLEIMGSEISLSARRLDLAPAA